MVFKLLNYPYLVQKEIITNMDFTSIVLLAKCSTRMDSVVYSLNYNIVELRYILNRKEFTVHVSTDGEKFDAVISFEFVKELLDNEDGFYAMQQILDHMIKLRITRDIEGKCVIQVCKRWRKLIQWKFQEEFQTLFRRVPEFVIHTPLRPILARNSSNCESVTMDGSIVKAEVVEEILSQFPNLKNVRLCWPFVDPVNADSKLLKLDSLVVEQCKTPLLKVLLRGFTGRHLILKNQHLDVLEVEEFINGWTSNETFPNMETIQIFTRRFPFDWEQILDRIQTQPFDSSKRPAFYSINSQKYMDSSSSAFDCSNWVDIERQGDRKLASIKASSKVIRFFVWN
ncbi:hypothetical protein CRE_27104 [Caenorhabditis remanei]|uniref:F-box domain-containing protein n=1 Tax=Caenorhabditis remanei TaxID=31234 RepID=E3LNF7_CAERE|nr:hypothetical protein CRE_27104 [Caenorhabditis remanei]